MQFISDADVRGAIGFADALETLQHAFRALGEGKAANLGRTRAGAAGRTISAMGAVLPYCGVMGVKAYPTVDGRFNFCIPLFGCETGELLAVVQGNALSEFRTAAATVIAARALARPGATTLALFGSGIQARAHAEAFVQHAGIQRVIVVDPHGDAAGLALSLATTHGIEATAADTHAALSLADVVVTATRAKTPLFDGGAVRPGTFVAAIGSSKPDTRETDDALLARCACIAVEEREQTLREAGDLVLAAPGVLRPERIATLGELLSSQPPYRRSNDADITLYKSVGIGVEDVALAHAVWKRIAARRPPAGAAG